MLNTRKSDTSRKMESYVDKKEALTFFCVFYLFV